MNSRKKLVIAGGSALLVAGVALGVSNDALASIPDSSGTIHGCYRTTNGDLRVIDTGASGTCLSDETSLNWSQGPATAGSGGLKVQVVTTYNFTGGTQIADCPTATPYVIGGGVVNVNGGSSQAAWNSSPYDVTTSSVPSGGENSTDQYGWLVTTVSGSWSNPINVYAICSA